MRTLPGRRRKIVQAAVAHAASFGTWRSLCVDQGLSDSSAVDLMVAMTAAAAGVVAPVPDGSGVPRAF